MKKALFLILCIWLCGCATCDKPTERLSDPIPLPSTEELAQLNYGVSPTGYEAKIKKYFDDVLVDPHSAVYEFDKPKKYWFREPERRRSQVYVGYVVKVKVNAKNRMGGYAGKQLWGFIFRGNEIIRTIMPAENDLIALNNKMQTGTLNKGGSETFRRNFDKDVAHEIYP
jgi:hypothetical protein